MIIKVNGADVVVSDEVAANIISGVAYYVRCGDEGGLGDAVSAVNKLGLITDEEAEEWFDNG